MHRLGFIGAATFLSVAATAQFTHVIPNGLAATEGNTSNAFPWGRGSAASLQIQTIYDSSHFTAAAINFPILISRLRWRMNGTSTTTGGTYTNATVDMATATVDALSPSTTFAANMAADQTQVYAGPVTLLAASPAMSPGIWVCDIPLTTSFLYDPSSGNDLVIFSDLPPGVGTGVGSAQLDVQSTGSLASRVYNSTAYGSGTGTITANHGVVVEITYVPANGLFAGFSATPTSGASPLTVQFTDTSFSSAPGGVTSWAWDFENDGIVDSTVQNPTHTYTTCGDYDVSLTVNDGTFPADTKTEIGFIAVDSVSPSFTFALLAAPNIYQFTDTTTPAAQAWAWDFENDGIVDSTIQNPVYVAPSSCHGTEVRLTATNLCRTDSIVESVFLTTNPAVTGELGGGNGTSSSTQVGNLFDVQITTPEGINVCGLVITPYSFTGQVDVEVYLTEDTHVGKLSSIGDWRLVSTGSGTSLGGSFSPPTPVSLGVSPFYLPAGNYGMAVFISNPAGTANLAYTNGPAAAPYVHPDLTIHPAGVGVARTALFGGSTFSPRLWNGGFYYNKCSVSGEASYGFFGTGCAGSLGVPNLDATALPELGGALSVDITNLPNNAAIMVLGLSKTVSAFGPLPIDLAPLGAPGCPLRVSTDSNAFLLGAGNQATYTLSLPNNPVLLCTRFYNQALVLDTGFNPLGAVLSDAAGGTIGN